MPSGCSSPDGPNRRLLQCVSRCLVPGSQSWDAPWGRAVASATADTATRIRPAAATRFGHGVATGEPQPLRCCNVLRARHARGGIHLQCQRSLENTPPGFPFSTPGQVRYIPTPICQGPHPLLGAPPGSAWGWMGCSCPLPAARPPEITLRTGLLETPPPSAAPFHSACSAWLAGYPAGTGKAGAPPGPRVDPRQSGEVLLGGRHLGLEGVQPAGERRPALGRLSRSRSSHSCTRVRPPVGGERRSLEIDLQSSVEGKLKRRILFLTPRVRPARRG